MFSSHSYPYAFNQSQHHSPAAAMPSPSPPQPQPSSRLSYPHPTPSHPSPGVSYPSSSSSFSMPTMGAVGAGGVGKGPSEFPLLEHLDVDELQRLLDCESKLNDIASDGNQNKQWQVDKEMAMAENRSLADFNMSRETRLREGRLQLARLHEEAKRLREAYDVNKRKLESLNENYSLDAAKVMLETAASKTEDESEEIAEEFLGGNLPLSDFVEQFNQRRMLAHIRRIKSDKMQELVKSTPNSAANPPQSVGIPMSMPLAHTSSPVRQSPAVPQPIGGHAPVYQPGYPSHGGHAPVAPQMHSSGSGWTPYPGAVRMPTLPAYPR